MDYSDLKRKGKKWIGKMFFLSEIEK